MAQPGTSLLRGTRRRVPRARVPTLLLLLILASPVAAAGVVVERVEVLLTVEGAGPPAVIQARLPQTANTVAQRLLAGRPVDQLRPLQAEVRATLVTVVDRVIPGYSVVETRLDVGATTVVTLRLRPEPPLIAAVEVTAQTAVDPAVAPLVLEPVHTAVASAARSLFVGLPVASLEWAGPLLFDEVRGAVEEAVPGFSAVVRVQPAARAQVQVEVAARDARVVRDIGVRFRSGSVPLLLLAAHAPAVVSLAGPLRGLPVVFVEQQRAALERLLADRLRAHRAAIAYRIVARPILTPGETTYVTVVADSLTWRARVEASLNIGTDAPPAELRAHLGRLFGRLEAFTEVALVPSPLSTAWDVGARYQVDGAFDIGASYTISSGETTGFVVYRLSPDITLRLAYAAQAQQVEGSVRYRFNEYLSGEVVGTSEGVFWLRLISNL